MVKNLRNLDSVRVQMNKTQKLHTNEQHNSWIKQRGFCPYCKTGSKPVPKAMILELIGK